ncbi:MAG: four helix bundle protein [Candidatus Omnitrophica bacterium]|nr:four helix bundle protein [Candidatus Omnitrophota bacterium]
MKTTSYRDLDIFNKAYRLAVEIHELSLDLPRHETYEEGSQIRRSSKSVASNIVEGFGRKRYKQEFVKFLIYSHASCDETLVHLSFLFDCGSFMDKSKFNYLREEYISLSKMINGFLTAVEEGHRTKTGS